MIIFLLTPPTISKRDTQKALNSTHLMDRIAYAFTTISSYQTFAVFTAPLPKLTVSNCALHCAFAQIVLPAAGITYSE
jgi:hypothetical protein